jgi:acyl carrier protein
VTQASADQIMQSLRRLAAAEANLSPAEAERIGRDTRLAELGMDSIAAASFVVEIEVAFKISLPPLILFECKTVGDVVDRIGRLLGDPVA